MRPFSLHFQRQAIGGPGNIVAVGIHALILKFSLIRSPHFEPNSWNKNSHTATGGPLRSQVFNCAQRGEICAVINGVPGVGNRSAAQHQPVAVSLGSADGCDYRSVLKFIDPDGTHPLIENAEGSEEASSRDSQVRISVVVDL